MKHRLINIGIVFIATLAFLASQSGHAQRETPRALRRPVHTRDSGPSGDGGPRSREGLADLLTKNAGNESLKTNQNENAKPSVPMDGTNSLLHRTATELTTPTTAAPQSALPTWSDSFVYQGLTYKYTMIGTDPKLGSKTTVIPTVIIPLRFVFPDGQVFDASTDLVDGQTAIQGIVNSPIFKNYIFVLGGKSVGNTQYADAFQRANFWDSVGSKSRDYHVLLSQPTVMPTQTIFVPDGLGTVNFDFWTGLPLPEVDRDFLESQTASILTTAQVTPSQLPIMVWGNMSAGNAFGYHGSTTGGNQSQTFIGTSYHSASVLNGLSADTYSLSHEIIEWLDDPFNNNYTPGWNQAFISNKQQCDSRYAGDLLETADPAEVINEATIALTGGQFTYHVTEGMFIDFYTRARRSRSVNGRYSMFNIGAQYGVPSAPSTPCTGHVALSEMRLFTIARSSLNEIYGINNQGSIVGIFLDQAGNRNGFLFDFTLTSGQLIDYPGALETIPSKINDNRVIVGFYIDPSGFGHGFTFENGQYVSLDFPGALDTAALDINLNGDIVGFYDTPDFNTHGFQLSHGVFSTIDIPFHRTTLATGNNSLGKIVGFSSAQFGDDGYPFQGFLRNGTRMSDVLFPGANETLPHDINNVSAIAGTFYNIDQYHSGFVTINGFMYEVYGHAFGLDDSNRIVGSYTIGDVTYAMMGNLPSAK